MIKRRYFTLLEVLISLTLSAVLLTSLLFFYRYLSELSSKANQIEIQNFQARTVETRLAEVFYAIVGEPFKYGEASTPAPPKEKEKGQTQPKEGEKEEAKDEKTAKKKKQENPLIFFSREDEGGVLKSGSSSLVFIFNNGASMNTAFANEVLACLFVDSQDRLCLAVWPHPKFWGSGSLPPMNLEVLMEGVDKLSLRFYVPPSEQKDQEEVEFPELKPGEWIPQWRREYEQLPAMLKVDVTLKAKQGPEQVVTFAYPLIDGSKVIEYTK